MGSDSSRGAAAIRDGLGWLLRAHFDGLAREPLPERWTELIRCMNEKERLRLKTELKESAELKESPNDRERLLRS